MQEGRREDGSRGQGWPWPQGWEQPGTCQEKGSSSIALNFNIEAFAEPLQQRPDTNPSMRGLQAPAPRGWAGGCQGCWARFPEDGKPRAHTQGQAVPKETWVRGWDRGLGREGKRLAAPWGGDLQEGFHVQASVSNLPHHVVPAARVGAAAAPSRPVLGAGRGALPSLAPAIGPGVGAWR